MILKIAHLADLHIRKTPTRNEEYEKVFENLIKSVKYEKPDRIVIVGDLVHDYLDLQGEQLILAHNLLNALADIAPVRITRGNHDCRKKNLKRVDSVRAIVKTLRRDDIIYYDKTGFYDDDNITWAVWHHGDMKNNPWKTKQGKQYDNDRTLNSRVYIDLFHDPITGCKSTTGFEMKSKSYYKISDFKGDYSLFGDIHRMQYLDKQQRKAYCGSLISQDFSEGDDNFHGYLLWNIHNGKTSEIEILNEYSFINIKITPYIDFDDLDFEINNHTKHMKIRFVWGTLPQARTKENERKLIEYVKSKYGENATITFAHKNEFLESEKIEINESITLQNITDKGVQQEIFKEFLSKIGADEQLIKDVIALDEEILNEINIIDDESIEWSIVKFGGTNFMSYGVLDIDWRDMDGLFQITGMNTHGKTTIMKIISYILYNKTLETESRMKFGDMRFVNNRNNANYCDAYIVIEANGEYYGIKKKTEIVKNKSGEITGAPTTLSYFVLPTPDDEMNDSTALEKLDEDRRVKTQKKIESIIGTYDNFMRIVMTTSDTLNRILSNDMADFIDSILFDAGLDIFDKKLEGFKVYQKRVNEKPRVTCNVEISTEQNATLTQEITVLEGEISNIETVVLPDIQNRISVGRKYVEDLTKKLYKIDSEIYNLDVDIAREDISGNKKNIVEIKAREMLLKQSIKSLKETYDVKLLEELNRKREEHKTNEYNQKLKIKGFEQVVRDEEHKIELINGDIFKLKQDGARLKKEITDLKNSKICSQCGQAINKPEHIEHVNKTVQIKEKEMFEIADKIKIKEDVDKKVHSDSIQTQKIAIVAVQKEIESAALEMETILKQIGDLTNDKNDVEKRKELQNELDGIPTKIQNEELKISILEQKITSHENSLLQIEENQKIEKGIVTAKQKIIMLEGEESDAKEDIFIRKTSIGEKQLRIKNNELLIAEFKAQEYRDNIMNLYKKCVHRDGIPRQMLTNYILPKINLTLENILSVAPFKVWLDTNDLRPKLVYNNRPASIIDCISASGKERTFSSVVLKFALNQINVKAKPTIFLLDEVMGKLDENSVEEFIEMLQLIKNNMKKVLVVEHIHEINPDYIISVQMDEDGISSLTLE
jgi:ribosomal protein S9